MGRGSRTTWSPQLSRRQRLIHELTAERDRLRRALVSFEEDAELRRELLRVAEPEAALQIAADSISRGSGVPVCFWWSEHQGTL